MGMHIMDDSSLSIHILWFKSEVDLLAYAKEFYVSMWHKSR